MVPVFESMVAIFESVVVIVNFVVVIFKSIEAICESGCIFKSLVIIKVSGGDCRVCG